MRLRWLLLGSAVLLAASAVAGIAQPRLAGSADSPAKTITVTGQGTVTTVPDRASFDFTVETRAATATAALAGNAAAATAVATAVKSQGVAPADIRTSQVSLQPQTNDAGTGIVGYTAANTVSVRTTIERAGALVDAAVGAGATGVSGPALSRSDEGALYRDALKKAVADARAKAKALAGAAGLSLAGVQTVVEGSAPLPVPLAGKLDATGTPVEPGTQTIDATVTVTYAAG